jgi:putative transposase
VTLDYLFLDGSHFRYHANAAAEPVLAAWASTPTASRSSSASTCQLRVRGRVGAGPQPKNQVILLRVHRRRNLLAEVSKNAQSELKADYWAVFDVPETIEPGPGAVAFVQ